MNTHGAGGSGIQGTANVVGNNNNVSINSAPPALASLHQLTSQRDFIGRVEELKTLMADMEGGVTISRFETVKS